MHYNALKNLLVLLANFTHEVPIKFVTEFTRLLSDAFDQYDEARNQISHLRNELDALRLDYANMVDDRNEYRRQAEDYAQRLANYRAKTREEEAVKAFNWLVANEQFAWDAVRMSLGTNKFIQLVKVVRLSEDPPIGLAASKDAAEKFLREVRPNPGLGYGSLHKHTWFQTNPADLKALREKLTGSSE